MLASDAQCKIIPNLNTVKLKKRTAGYKITAVTSYRNTVAIQIQGSDTFGVL